jgi:hypothetical protein
MKVKKELVVQSLRDQGHHEEAERAIRELPEHVDSASLADYDIDTRELFFRLGGEYSK